MFFNLRLCLSKFWKKRVWYAMHFPLNISFLPLNNSIYSEWPQNVMKNGAGHISITTIFHGEATTPTLFFRHYPNISLCLQTCFHKVSTEILGHYLRLQFACM